MLSIIKGLWVRLCKWHLCLSSKIESLILISLSVEDFNFGCYKIVQPKKGECGKIFENYTRFEWGVEMGVVTIFMLRLFIPHEFDMYP